jgi:hypothetical protein
MAHEHARIQACGIHPGAHTFDIILNPSLPFTEGSTVTGQVEPEDPFSI